MHWATLRYIVENEASEQPLVKWIQTQDLLINLIHILQSNKIVIGLINRTLADCDSTKKVGYEIIIYPFLGTTATCLITLPTQKILWDEKHSKLRKESEDFFAEGRRTVF